MKSLYRHFTFYSLVISRLDYCSSFFYHIPSLVPAPLNRIIRSCIHIVFTIHIGENSSTDSLEILCN